MARSLEAVSVDKLEGLLSCSICLETLKAPRTLPCFHSYCKSCLERFVKNHRDKALGRQMVKFNCPNCRSEFTLNPGDEVADMMPNHFVCNMLDVMAVQERVKVLPCSHCQRPSIGRCVTCEVFLCQECLTVHNSYRGFKNHSVLSMDELSKPENQGNIRGKLYCKEHSKKALKFYCETCSELICRYCMDFNHLKANHSCHPAEKVADQQKKLLVSDCYSLAKELKRGKDALQAISDVTQSLGNVKEEVKREISRRRDDILNAVTQQLNKEVERLMGQVEEIYSTKQNNLAKQKDEVKGYVDKLESCVNLSTGLLEKGTDEEILSSIKMIKENMEKVQNENLQNLKPADNDKIHFKYDTTEKFRIHEIRNKIGMVENSENLSFGNTVTDDTSKCPICFDAMTNPKKLSKCGHSFCTDCIDNAVKHQQKCPICSEVYGVLTGNQPQGQMSNHSNNGVHLPGFKGCGIIVINYNFPSGKQGPNHPNPGRPYTGTRREAYLPDTEEGRKVLRLLNKAFIQKLTFTIGRSSTTGVGDTVTWNDIHHKTSYYGGPTNFGYPDASYLKRVQDELAAKGIKE